MTLGKDGSEDAPMLDDHDDFDWTGDFDDPRLADPHDTRNSSLALLNSLILGDDFEQGASQDAPLNLRRSFEDVDRETSTLLAPHTPIEKYPSDDPGGAVALDRHGSLDDDAMESLYIKYILLARHRLRIMVYAFTNEAVRRCSFIICGLQYTWLTVHLMFCTLCLYCTASKIYEAIKTALRATRALHVIIIAYKDTMKDVEGVESFMSRLSKIPRVHVVVSGVFFHAKVRAALVVE